VDEALKALPSSSLGLVEAVLATAVRTGAEVYLVGGPVRDLLLEREIRDVDLLVETGDGSAGAATLARAAAPARTRVVEHGRFGTVRLESSEASIDLASARRETYARPGALPDVEAGSLEEDLRRRDFTVNALALRLTAAGRVPVLDVSDGLSDLRARRLRVLHPRSFHDDPTRALRAARLAPRLGFSLSRSSRVALRDALRDGAFGGVSGERLRRELEKCFGDAALGLDPARALRLLEDWHVLAALEPGLEMPREAAASLRRLGRAIAEPPWRGPPAALWLAGLSLWLAALSPALRRRSLRRFALNGDPARRVTSFPAARDRWLRGLERARGRGAVDALLGEIDEADLHALYASAGVADRRRIVRWAAEDRARRAPLGGDDLLGLGLAGPAVGRALSRIRSAWLDGEVANREEAIALAQELARNPSSRRRRPAPKARG
jgi:tRNA nucleotidyltransferase (CCA-adding enzyme)